MSIFSISNKALVRLSSKNSNQPQTYIADIEQISLKKTEAITQNVEASTNILFSYVPVEIIALYVAVIGSLKTDPLMKAQWISFYIFVFLTPIVLWLIYSAKIKELNKPLPIHPKDWPIWEMIASTLAFITWAFALPGSPFSIYEWYNQSVGGVMVLVTSTVLGLISPFFNKE